jgi:hypothetical protein
LNPDGNLPKRIPIRRRLNGMGIGRQEQYRRESQAQQEQNMSRCGEQEREFSGLPDSPLIL